MVFLLQKTTSVPVISFDTQHFLNRLMLDSGEMSFQAVLLHWPRSASDGLLMFPADVCGQFPDGSHSAYRLYSHQQLTGHTS
jgi:hypothetical protein